MTDAQFFWFLVCGCWLIYGLIAIIMMLRYKEEWFCLVFSPMVIWFLLFAMYCIRRGTLEQGLSRVENVLISISLFITLCVMAKLSVIAVDNGKLAPVIVLLLAITATFILVLT